jgi:hypothetical protein
VQMTRPLCPYPQLAKYKGEGDTNDASNFTCQALQLQAHTKVKEKRQLLLRRPQ